MPIRVSHAPSPAIASARGVDETRPASPSSSSSSVPSPTTVQRPPPVAAPAGAKDATGAAGAYFGADPTAAARRVVSAGPRSSAGVSTATLARHLAASTKDVERAVDALLAAPSTPFAERVQATMQAAGRIDRRSAKDPDRLDACVRVAALFTALMPFIGADGTLDVNELKAACGPAGAPLLAALDAAARRSPPVRTNWAFLADLVQVLQASLPKTEALGVVNAFLRDDAILPRRIDSLDAVTALVDGDRFKDQGLVAVQHLLPSTLPLYEALIEKGMRPEGMFVLGTPYGSNPLVAAVLRLMGIEAEPGIDRLQSTAGFEEQRIDAIHRFVHRHGAAMTQAKPAGGFLLLDDGGLLQLAVTGGKMPATMPPDIRESWRAALGGLFPPGTHAVEQTTRGITELSARGPAFTTVTVALCDAKKKEGEVIGDALLDSTLTALAQRGKLPAERAVVVSGGVVGLRTAAALRDQGIEVTIVDLDPEKRAAAEAAGFASAASLGPTCCAVSTCSCRAPAGRPCPVTCSPSSTAW